MATTNQERKSFTSKDKNNWSFMRMFKECSLCGEEQCETLYKNEANEEFYTRDCEPITYNMLPKSLKKELGLEED